MKDAANYDAGMILFMGFAAPSGLVLYWITGNLFTMMQTMY